MSGDFDRLKTGDIVRIMLDDGELQYHVVTHADGRTCASRPTTVDDWNEQAERHDVIAPSLSKHPTLIWNHGYPYWEDEKPEQVSILQPRFMDIPLMPAPLQFPREVYGYGGEPKIYGQDWWGPNDPNAPEWVQVMQRQAKEYAAAQLASFQIMAAETETPLSLLHTTDASASYDDVLLAYQRHAPPRPFDPDWKPPKRTWRIRFRIWRHHTNHRVQQWIHDHLPEAYCDN